MLRAFLSFCTGVLLVVQVCPAQAKLDIFACEPEWQALTKELGGDLVSIYTATTAHQDPHYIEPRPSLIARARSADMLVCTGAELETGWLPVVQRQSGNSWIQSGEAGAFFAAEQVQRLEIPDHVDRSAGHVHASGNPHVHLDPRRILAIARSLSTRLAQVDPENRERYQDNYEAFSEAWNGAMKNWQEVGRNLDGAGAVVHHGIWTYLFDWLGIQEVASLEPKPGVPPTTTHLSGLIEVVEQKSPDFIIHSNYQVPRAAKWLSERTGVPVLELPYTVGAEDGVDDLFVLMETLVTRLSGYVE